MEVVAKVTRCSETTPPHGSPTVAGEKLRDAENTSNKKPLMGQQHQRFLF